MFYNASNIYKHTGENLNELAEHFPTTSNKTINDEVNQLRNVIRKAAIFFDDAMQAVKTKGDIYGNSNGQ